MTDPSEVEPPPVKKADTFWLIIGGIVLTSVVVGCIVASLKGGDDVDGYDAQVACKDFVRDRLKAPATADFSGLSHTGAGNSWTVTGAVDAENSFGTPLRMNWTCSVRLDGDMWRLQSLTGLR